MDSNRWQKVKAAFEQALDYPPHERLAFLDHACHGDDDLRQEVLSLLASREQHPSFMAEPLLVDAARRIEEASSHAGKHIGAYRLAYELGRGGMGAVYLAERDDGQFQQQVAVKLIRHGLEDEDLRRRFFRERQILARLQHPNIAQLFDGGVTEDGQPYLVMEYVEGIAIDRYCDEHHLSTARRIHLFRTVCAAVHYAHQNLIVHRDLKPSNILVTDAGTIKLLDFGIAKLLDEDAYPETIPLTRTGLRVMTPEYASPEQVRSAPVTTASDIYALGMILYELLTGQRPYQLRGLTPGEVERIVCEQAPGKPSTAVTRIGTPTDAPGETRALTPERVSRLRSTQPEKLRRGLKGDLDNIVLMALRKEPSRRYVSAEQLSEDLRRHLAGLPVMARTDTLRYRVAKFVQRHRVGVATTVVGIVCVAGLIGFYTIRLTQERDRARLETTKAEQISTFLQEMLSSVDPNRDGREVRVIEVLNEAARRVATELHDQPEIEAAVHTTLGVTYRNLGLYPQAEPHLQRALAIRKKAYGEEHPDVARSLHDLGWLFYRRGDYPQAEQFFSDALTMQRALLGEEHLDVARTWHSLALVLMPRGDYAGAEAASRRALEIHRALLGEEHLDVAEDLGHLGMALWGQGHYEAAELLLRRALATKRNVMGGDHLSVLNTMHNLALVLKDEEDYPAAESLMRASNALTARLLGDDHPDVAIGLLSLASVMQAQDSLDEAERLHRQALALRRRLLGDDNHEVAGSLSFLAQVVEAKGNYDEAERLHREALAIRRALYGEDHLDVAYSLYYLGVVLRKKGAYDEAEHFARRSLAVSRRVLGPDHPDVVYDLTSLAATLEAQGRYDEAEALLLEGYVLLDAQPDGVPVGLLQRLAELYDAWGKPDEADRYRALIVDGDAAS
jgi:serine/threonine-protein kinase